MAVTLLADGRVFITSSLVQVDGQLHNRTASMPLQLGPEQYNYPRIRALLPMELAAQQAGVRKARPYPMFASSRIVAGWLASWV